MHALAPLTRRDRRTVEDFAPNAVEASSRVGHPALRTEDGRCVLWRADEGCSLQAARGREAKPTPCRRFPFGAVGTPTGVRLTTAHRCPCRTLGERPPLVLVEASASFPEGLPRPTRHVGERVPLTSEVDTTFERYEAWERSRIAELAAGGFALDALGTTPALPALDGAAWPDVGAFFGRASGQSASFDCAAQWFGFGVERVLGQTAEAPPRPWCSGFDRAVRRAGPVGSAAKILGDYLADVLWGLGWVEVSALDVALTELTVRYLVLEALTEHLATSERMDRAAAEAVMIVEVATETETWAQCVRSMTPLPGLAPEVG